MKPKPYLLLCWDSVAGRMERHLITTVKEARVIVQAQYDRQRLSHVLGQVVRTDDSRLDVYPKRNKRGES